MGELPVYTSIVLELKNKTAYIYLNKPEKNNSICGMIIEELYNAFQFIESQDRIRSVVLSNKGEYFCVGPDFEWLNTSLAYSRKESVKQSLIVGKLLFMIYSFSKPVICKVNGSAAGCGVGLMSVCDIVIAAENTELIFDEVKYGFTPSLYAPYVIKKIGESRACELFITGRNFSANEAKEIGLVNYVVLKEKLDEKTESIIEQLNTSGPQSISMIKDVLAHIKIMRYDEVLKYTSECVADLKSSDETKEGISAKLANRDPGWV